LVLRDTYRSMLCDRLIGWESGSLRALTEAPVAGREYPRLHDGISWLAALMPLERRILSQATIDLHNSGSNLLSPAADMPFRRVVARMLHGVEGAGAAERRLSMVRRQLGIA
jgi:hypothetical protein